MNNQFNLLRLLEIVLAWKKPIIIVCLISLVGSYIITYPDLKIIPPEYESLATIFPANPSLTDRPYLFKTEAGGEMAIDMFGTKEDIDRLISIAKSAQIKMHIVNTFNLYAHYEIDTTEKYFLSSTISKFKKNYEITKNEYGAIEIHICDKDKNLAADIANEVVAKIDDINKNMIRKNRLSILKVFEKQLSKKRKEVNLLTDSLINMRNKFRVYDIQSQGNTLTKEITLSEAKLKSLKAQKVVLAKGHRVNDSRILKLSAKIEGFEKKLNGLIYAEGNNKFNLELFTEGADKIKVLQNRHDAAIEELRITNKTYEQYLVATNPNISSIYVMEKAYPSEKAVPLQLIAVSCTFLLTLFLSIVTATLIVTYKKP